MISFEAGFLPLPWITKREMAHKTFHDSLKLIIKSESHVINLSNPLQ